MALPTIGFRLSDADMPTALKLELLMDEMGEKNAKRLAALTGLDEAVVVRCKKLLSYPRRYQDLMLELLANVGHVYLVLIAATRSAIKKISDETNLSVRASYRLGDGDNIFSETCRHFSAADRTRLLHYCRRAASANPQGYGACGLVVVFQHRTPNNSIPILHVENARWSGLFPRHE
jgi:hypothetical protein